MSTQLCQPVLATAHAQIVIVPYIATVTANTIIHTPAFLEVTSILTILPIAIDNIHTDVATSPASRNHATRLHRYNTKQ